MAREGNFTARREPIDLILGGERFKAPAVIPPTVLGLLWGTGARFADAHTKHQDDRAAEIAEVLVILDEAFGKVLDEGSRARFRQRLHSETEPFDLNEELMPALSWLIEEYSGRPTRPSPPSSTGSDDGGTPSTAGAPSEESTPSTSPPTGSATSPSAPSTP